MNFPREKRADLFKLAIATAILLLTLWFIVGRSGQATIQKRQNASSDLQQKINAKKKIIQQADQTKVEISEKSKKLSALEDQMVIGDPYLWVLKTLREFESSKEIEFSRYDPPQIVTSVFPQNNPYETVAFVVAGAASYHDLGSFLARLENSFPHVRVRRVDLQPIMKTDEEKLSFLLEFHVLVKPEPKTVPSTTRRS